MELQALEDDQEALEWERGEFGCKIVFVGLN